MEKMKTTSPAAIEGHPYIVARVNMWWLQIIDQRSRAYVLGALSATAAFVQYYTGDHEAASEIAFLAELVACQL